MAWWFGQVEALPFSLVKVSCESIKDKLAIAKSFHLGHYEALEHCFIHLLEVDR